MFNEINKSFGPRFTFNSDELPFTNLDDYVGENGNKSFTVKAVFVHVKGKEKYPAVVSESAKIWLPIHLTETIEAITSNPELITAINEGKCKFTPKQYEKTGKYAGTYNSGIFEDI